MCGTLAVIGAAACMVRVRVTVWVELGSVCGTLVKAVIGIDETNPLEVELQW